MRLAHILRIQIAYPRSSSLNTKKAIKQAKKILSEYLRENQDGEINKR